MQRDWIVPLPDGSGEVRLTLDCRGKATLRIEREGDGGREHAEAPLEAAQLRQLGKYVSQAASDSQPAGFITGGVASALVGA